MVFLFSKKEGLARAQINVATLESDLWATDQVLVAASDETIFPKSVGKWLHDHKYLKGIKKKTELELPSGKKVTCISGRLRISLGDDKGKWTEYFDVQIHFSDAAIDELGPRGVWTGSIGTIDLAKHAAIRDRPTRIELDWPDPPPRAAVKAKPR